jgi:hypothetical protein
MIIRHPSFDPSRKSYSSPYYFYHQLHHKTVAYAWTHTLIFFSVNEHKQNSTYTVLLWIVQHINISEKRKYENSIDVRVWYYFLVFSNFQVRQHRLDNIFKYLYPCFWISVLASIFPAPWFSIIEEIFIICYRHFNACTIFLFFLQLHCPTQSFSSIW